MYVFATVALCTLIIIITWLGFRSELTIESGSVDGQVETMISFNDWESINGYVLNGGISSGKAENVLNRGYCLQYMDSGRLPERSHPHFTPASQKSSSSASSTSSSRCSRQQQPTTADLIPRKVNTNSTKTYTDAEIDAAWKAVTTVDPTCATGRLHRI